MAIIFGLPLLGFILTCALLFLFINLSQRYYWFDKPDEDRKLHSIATPTSAGLVFMLPIAMMNVVFPQYSIIPSLYLPLILVVLTLVGAYDDFFGLSIKIRMAIIAIVALIELYLLFDIKNANHFIMIVYFLGVVWWMNLYNFMDGADGMAVLHALISILGYCAYFLLFTDNDLMVHIHLILVLACLIAFLLFNFPQSKIFMGDAGSLSLAFLIAFIALYGISQGVFDEILVISFHLVFIVDATLTLFIRIRYKHPFTQAHNLHLYQALITSGISHVKVSLYYALVTATIVTITFCLKFLEVSQSIKLIVFVLECVILSVYWYKYHNKTKFKRFIR